MCIVHILIHYTISTHSRDERCYSVCYHHFYQVYFGERRSLLACDERQRGWREAGHTRGKQPMGSGEPIVGDQAYAVKMFSAPYIDHRILHPLHFITFLPYYTGK